VYKMIVAVSTVAACACGRTDPCPEAMLPVQCEADSDCAVTRVPAVGGCATLCPPIALPAGEVQAPLDGCPAFECRILGTFHYAPACDAGTCTAVPEPPG
jgi:hypothetical protein